MPDLRSQSLHYLRDGRVKVLDAITPEGELRPVVVRARVDGHHGAYEVVLADTVWSCPCGRLVCPHIPAVQLCTNWPSKAAKTYRQGRAA